MQARAKKLKESLQTLIQAIEEQVGSHKAIEEIGPKQATIYTLSQMEEKAAQEG